MKRFLEISRILTLIFLIMCECPCIVFSAGFAIKDYKYRSLSEGNLREFIGEVDSQMKAFIK